MTIKQPVSSRAESNTVLDHVRPAVGHRPNVRGLNLGFPAPVDDAQPRNCAGVVVSFANVSTKVRITNPPVQKDLLNQPFLHLLRTSEQPSRLWIGMFRIEFEANC